MSHTVLHVLALCTGSSCHSVVGEALVMALGQGRFRGMAPVVSQNTFLEPHGSDRGLRYRETASAGDAESPIGTHGEARNRHRS
jgi:hypothetical protein